MLDEKKLVNLNGFNQKIHIISMDETKPVLLFLHGGPGVTNRHSVINGMRDLLDTFTIVAWDQRGTGGSYKGLDPKTLTIKQMIEDARALVEYLCNRFKKEKIFIIGGSWGSELGTYLSYYYPQHIAAYVGFGQVVNIELNEKLTYNFALEEAIKHNDKKAISTLKEIGEPVMGCYKGGFDGMMAQRKVMMKYGGYSQNNKKRSYSNAMVWPMISSGEYSISDLIGIIKGHKVVLSTMWQEIGKTDFKKTCTKFDVPFYIFDGKLDMNTPASLVEDWFNMIEADDKCLIWFENSGHNPLADEPEKFKKLLIEKLLAVKEKSEALI